jgi:uncharacterized protein DUF4872/butirosin biosynthesis protein H-like
MHRKGIHCGSTAMADALRLRGLELPEERIFGLGAGLDLSLHHGDTALAPPQAGRFFVGRSASFERDLCEVIGAVLDERHYQSAREALDDLRPHDLVYTDLFHLPYLDAHGHWFGHLIGIAEIHQGDVLVWDNEREEPQQVATAQLSKALGEAPPVQRGRGVTVLRVTSAPKAVAEDAARNAVRRNAIRMTNQGLPAIAQLASEFESWRTAGDWPRRARLAAQVIEKRGCGGGLFRRLYARFLEHSLPDLSPLCLKAADEWTGFAEKLDTPSIAACAAAEAALWSRAMELCG